MIVESVYICEVCGEEYREEEKARVCEARPVTRDKGAKVGDTVLVTYGDGRGATATVGRIFVMRPSWNGERYWHAVAVEAITRDGYSRLLAFTDYELAQA